MYAVVAISVMLIAVMGVAGFYSLNVWREPWLLVFFGAIATVTGLVTRRVAARRHRAAHQAEYDLTE
jgi:membrane protein implicated in regulation of membrane protease activity